jgi:hypothetical protein
VLTRQSFQTAAPCRIRARSSSFVISGRAASAARRRRRHRSRDWAVAGRPQERRASLAAYVGSFAIGLGPVLLAADLGDLPIGNPRARHVGATIANWLANLVVALTFLDLVDLLGRPGVFFVYAALAFGALLFARALVPETKGLSLEAVEALWVGRASDKRPTIAPAKPVTRK